MNVDGPEALSVLLFLALGIGGLALWVWTLVDAIRVPDDAMYRAGTKLIWVVVIVAGGVIGSIVYLAIGRPSGSTQARRPAGPPPPPPSSGWSAP